MSALNQVDVELCIERIAAYQTAHGLSDVQLARQFPALGSPRTWARLAVKDFAAAPVESWGGACKKIYDEIEGRASTGNAADAPISLVSRHLAEAHRCRIEGNVTLARAHCRTARQAIEHYQRQLAAPRSEAPAPQLQPATSTGAHAPTP